MFTKIFLPLFFSVAMATTVAGDFTCPPAADIAPCLCEVSALGSTLYCEGESTTQSTIDNLFAISRLVNNVTSNDRLHVSFFVLMNSTLTSLDLTFLAQTDVDFLAIEGNPNLGTFIGATNSTDEVDILPFQFKSQTLHLNYNGLSGGIGGIVEILKFAEPTSLKFLQMTFNHVGQTNEDDYGLLLSMVERFENLQDFYLDGNALDMLDNGGSGGYFKNNVKLIQLSFRSNKIRRVGPQAFAMNEPPGSMNGLWLYIDLTGNGLADQDFDPGHGLNSTGRLVFLLLEHNNFEFVSAENFEPFLMADSLNRVSFYGNPFVCDGRMRWLHDRREEYESRVHGVECTNDPGETIFTTSLLD